MKRLTRPTSDYRADVLREVKEAVGALKSNWIGWEDTTAENYHEEVLAEIDKLAATKADEEE
jgi:hypothetical protein